ncbi:MAG: hypothetical protein WC005_02720 [Candidatus Nanopelagicales bacterium]
MRSRIAAVALLASMGALSAASSAYADAPPYALTWAGVPAKVTHAQTVWALTNTAGLAMHSTTGIASQRCTGQPGYIVSALYGQKSDNQISVNEQPVATCADAGYTFYGVVSSIKVPHATISVEAQCGFDVKTNKPVAGWTGNQKCSPGSVKTTGGLIHVVQTSSTNAKSKSVVWIETTGLNYSQLAKIASGMKPLY